MLGGYGGKFFPRKICGMWKDDKLQSQTDGKTKLCSLVLCDLEQTALPLWIQFSHQSGRAVNDIYIAELLGESNGLTYVQISGSVGVTWVPPLSIQPGLSCPAFQRKQGQLERSKGSVSHGGCITSFLEVFFWSYHPGNYFILLLSLAWIRYKYLIAQLAYNTIHNGFYLVIWISWGILDSLLFWFIYTHIF